MVTVNSEKQATQMAKTSKNEASDTLDTEVAA